MQATSVSDAAAIERFPTELLNPYTRNTVSSVMLFDELDSTNTRLKSEAVNGAPHGTVVIASSQTAGRGRLGKTFYSPADTGLYMSLLYKQHDCARKELFLNSALFTTTAAVAVCRAISRLMGIQLHIKWVNDLYSDNRKICGILTEGALTEQGLNSVVIGIGVNITTINFPADIENKAGSLIPVGKYTVSSNISLRLQLAASILNELFPLLDSGNSIEIMNEYKSRSFILGKRISVITPKESFDAVATDITNEGFLLITKDDGETQLLNSGEISIQSFL